MYVERSSSGVDSSAPHVCRHDRVTREAGCVGLMVCNRWERHSDIVPVYLYCRAFSVSVSLGI